MALQAGIKAVNLGCGQSVAPGWINVDNSPNARLSKYPFLRWLLWKGHMLSDKHYAVKWPSNIIIHNLRKKLPFPDNSIDYVYASHVLEHLSRNDGDRFLKDIHRVLKIGGVVRIVVPDLSIGVRNYVDKKQANPDDPEAAPQLLNWMQLGKPGRRAPHLWLYDAPSLRAAFMKAGYTDVIVTDYKQGRVPDVDILDHRPTDSLHMEAGKVA